MLAVYGKETNEIGVQSITTPGSSRAQSTLFSHVHPSQVSKLLHKILDLGTPGNKFIAWAKSTQRGHENINHIGGIAHTTASTGPPCLHLLPNCHHRQRHVCHHLALSSYFFPFQKKFFNMKNIENKSTTGNRPLLAHTRVL